MRLLNKGLEWSHSDALATLALRTLYFVSETVSSLIKQFLVLTQTDTNNKSKTSKTCIKVEIICSANDKDALYNLVYTVNVLQFFWQNDGTPTICFGSFRCQVCACVYGSCLRLRMMPLNCHINALVKWESHMGNVLAVCFTWTHSTHSLVLGRTACL